MRTLNPAGSWLDLVQFVKKLNFPCKALLRIRGVDHVEQKLVVARLLEYQPVAGIRFHGAGPEVSANGAGTGLRWPGCAHGLTDLLDCVFSPQLDDLHRPTRHVF